MRLKNYNDRNITISILFMLLIFIFTLFTLFGSIEALSQYQRGSLAPDFTLKALDGELYELSQFNNKQDHLLICFVKSDDSKSIGKLQDLINFLEDYQPRENYQIITVIKTGQDIEKTKEQFLRLQEKTEIPIIILIDTENRVIENYQIKRFPTFLLLRTDLNIHRTFDRFTAREERSFYQYLSFLFTSQKSSGSNNSSECDDDGVCPPPPGY